MQKSNKDLFVVHTFPADKEKNNGWYGELSAKTKIALDKDKKLPINTMKKKYNNR